MPAVLATSTLRRAQVVRCSGARRCVRARAEEGSKVTREYNEASEKVTSAQGSQEGGKTDENGNFFIDERPVRSRSSAGAASRIGFPHELGAGQCGPMARPPLDTR